MSRGSCAARAGSELTGNSTQRGTQSCLELCRSAGWSAGPCVTSIFCICICICAAPPSRVRHSTARADSYRLVNALREPMLLGSVPLSRFEDRSLRARRRVRSERTDRSNQIKSNQIQTKSNQTKPNQSNQFKPIGSNQNRTKRTHALALRKQTYSRERVPMLGIVPLNSLPLRFLRRATSACARSAGRGDRTGSPMPGGSPSCSGSRRSADYCK